MRTCARYGSIAGPCICASSVWGWRDAVVVGALDGQLAAVPVGRLHAGALSHGGLLRWWFALPVCIAGVLSGDMVLYWTGRHWGERVLNWRVVRWVLTPQREEWLKDAYCRHAVKTVVTVRHVVGLRAAAFLTAGIARVPFWKFVLADASAAVVGVPFSFGLAYVFTDQIGAILAWHLQPH